MSAYEASGIHCPYRYGCFSLGNCTGFAWQGFGSRGATGVASLRSCQNFPQCLTEPMPAEVDPLLAKVKAISDGGSAPGIT